MWIRILRFLTVVAIAIRFGGFTFYSTVVIATAQWLASLGYLWITLALWESKDGPGHQAESGLRNQA
jgi:hypothetical protein